ncbi:hypothetical protein ACIP5T_09865 [Microbacterium sp. NPDC088619]|uniref:hypothetical protein n=1 Tax=Microbacterium sp. NPDC088619 TaxID=3364196 RepID=UPI003819541E
MYEHPYFTEKVAEYENERLERAVECRRFLAEHADQLVPRAPGAVRRLGQRMLRVITRPRSTATDAVANAAPDAVANAAHLAATPAPRVARVAAPAEMATAAPADRLAVVGCEPAAAR